MNALLKMGKISEKVWIIQFIAGVQRTVKKRFKIFSLKNLLMLLIELSSSTDSDFCRYILKTWAYWYDAEKKSCYYFVFSFISIWPAIAFYSVCQLIWLTIAFVFFYSYTFAHTHTHCQKCWSKKANSTTRAYDLQRCSSTFYYLIVMVRPYQPAYSSEYNKRLYVCQHLLCSYHTHITPHNAYFVNICEITSICRSYESFLQFFQLPFLCLLPIVINDTIKYIDNLLTATFYSY